MIPALEIENLCKRYNKDIIALKNISFSIEQGDFFGLLGPNGAGKTTFLRMLVTLTKKTSGKIRIFGHDLDKNPQLTKQFIGLVPQEFNFNVFDSVERILLFNAGYFGIPQSTAIKRAHKWLKQLKLWEKRHTLAKNLSGGMKRRLMIARAMMHNPKLLILDEPTAGVDLEIRHDIWNLLQSVNKKGVTIIFTTHYLEYAEKLCKKIAIIHHGSLIEHCPTQALIHKFESKNVLMTLKNPLKTKNLNLKHPGFECTVQNPHTLSIKISKEQNLHTLFACLSQHAIEVTHMGYETSRLESLFIEKTHE